MVGSLSLWIGRRLSRSKHRHQLVSFISVSSIAGIAFGVAVIIIGLSAMNGFERELKNRVLAVVPQAEFEGVRAPIQDWQSMKQEILKSPHAVAAAPYVQFTALAERGTQLKAIQVRGIDLQQEKQVTDLFNFVSHGDLKTFQAGQHQAILGRGVAEKLGLRIGDEFTLMVPQTSGRSTSLKAPKRIRVRLTAMLTLHGQIDHTLAIIPMADAQSYVGLGHGVTGISMKVDDVFRATYITRLVGSQLKEYVYLKSWQRQYGYLYRDIQLVRTIMYLVMVLVIGVASFNIVSTLMMSVKDRASEIAILRTMGATDRLIRRIFLWQGLFSGVVGSVIGSVIGVLVAQHLTSLIQSLEDLIHHQFLSGDIYFVDFLPSQVQPHDVLVVSITALILSLFASIYPAYRASHLAPAQVLSSK